jgi:hypothetical protein
MPAARVPTVSKVWAPAALAQPAIATARTIGWHLVIIS